MNELRALVSYCETKSHSSSLLSPHQFVKDANLNSFGVPNDDGIRILSFVGECGRIRLSNLIKVYEEKVSV